MDIPHSKVLSDLLGFDKYKIIVMQGSSRSTKTYSSIQYCIIKALEKKERRILMAKVTLQDVKESLFLDFRDIVDKHFKCWNQSSMNKTDWIYTFPNGSTITFTGLLDESARKLHGPKFNFVYINECNYIAYNSVQQLLLRLERGKMLLDFNPNVPEDFWIYKKILGGRPDAILHHSTFRDNPWLDIETEAEILKLEPTEENIANGTADEAQWKIYGLGIRADVVGAVFNNWCEVDLFPKGCENVCYGMDFGFTNDPTTLVLKGEKDDKLFLQCLLYEKALSDIVNPHDLNQASIEGRFKEFGIRRDLEIWADCADPRAINNIKSVGFNIKKAEKPAGSVLEGITIMKRYKICVVRSAYSSEFMKELENYIWKKNRSGDFTNEPVDKFNHCIAKGSLVTTLRGEIPIENITCDDYVLTRMGYKKVIKAWKSGTNRDVAMLVSDNGNYVLATKEHKIFTRDRGFVKLSELEGEDKILTLKYSQQKFNRILKILDYPKKKDVYDLSVDGEHEFFANGILVHNCIDSSRYATYMSNPSFRKSNGMIFYDTIAANKIEKRHDIFYMPSENDIDDDDDY